MLFSSLQSRQSVCLLSVSSESRDSQVSTSRTIKSLPHLGTQLDTQPADLLHQQENTISSSGDVGIDVVKVHSLKRLMQGKEGTLEVDATHGVFEPWCRG